MGVRLLHGATQMQHIPLDVGSPIVHATTADPYLTLLTEDGQVINLTLRETRGVTKLVVGKTAFSKVPLITTVCLYRDLSGLFSYTIPEEVPEPMIEVKHSTVVFNPGKAKGNLS